MMVVLSHLSFVIYYAAIDDSFIPHPHSILSLFQCTYYSYRLICPLRQNWGYAMYISSMIPWHLWNENTRREGPSYSGLPTQTHQERMEHLAFRTFCILHTKTSVCSCGFLPPKPKGLCVHDLRASTGLSNEVRHWKKLKPSSSSPTPSF